MTIRDLIPWGRQESGTRLPIFNERRGDSPLLTLHREMNRLFDDLLPGWDLPALGSTGRNWSWPSVEVREADDAIRITAELPGLSERDVELSVDDNVLTIRGERHEEKDDRSRGFSERFYGQFERRIALPSGVETEKAKADFRDGVLTVTLPRNAEASNRRRIPISGETRH